MSQEGKENSSHQADENATSTLEAAQEPGEVSPSSYHTISQDLKTIQELILQQKQLAEEMETMLQEYEAITQQSFELHRKLTEKSIQFTRTNTSLTPILIKYREEGLGKKRENSPIDTESSSKKFLKYCEQEIELKTFRIIPRK